MRLSSDDVYATLDESRKVMEFLIHAKDHGPGYEEDRRKHMAILQGLEDGLRSMFGQALRDTPKLAIPRKEKP
ncbi:MAG: hypothetical protein MZV70_36300 [Desulfobacterales bacterium]|nr:hypothetical protein [Desulfobacterales bacterium]